MHIYLPVAVFAVISMVYCEAFSAMDNKISTRRASLSSITTTATATTARTIISTDVTLNFRRQQRISTLISAMTTSDENDTITTTTTTTTSLIKAEEEEEEEEDTKNENEEKSNIPFDDVAWMAYETMMTKIAMQTRRVKNFNEESVSKCRTYLLSREQYIPSVPDVIENEKSILQSSIRNQAESFRQRFNFTSDEFDFVTRSFVKLGDMSAKNQSKNRNNKNNNVNIDNDNEIDHRLPVAVAWYKLKEMGSIPQENSMSTYMYILSSSNSSSNNNNDDDDRSDDDNDDEIAVAIVDDALLEVVTCHDVLYKKNEKTLTIRMKSLVGRGRIDEAEEIFAASFESSSSSSSSSTSEEEESKNEISKERDNKNNNNQVGRLRTYMPLMEHYCRVGDLTSILRLYRKMQDSTGVNWDVESYTILLSSLARFGYFFTDNDNQQKNDDNEEYGSNLFDTLVSNMASDILELTEATFLDLTESFRIGHRDHLNLTSIDNNNNNENENESSAMEIVVDRVEIPTQNGTCPTTGVKLRLLSLDDTQRQHVHDTLLEMARTSTEIFIDMNIEREARNLERQARQRKPTRNNKNKAVKSNSNKGETVTGHIFGDVENKEINKEAYGYQELLRFSKWLE
jgi:pentatricopeptide repeat protein